ncbi:hypothetical protein SDC9_73461 [bioreactor metagenome]|uniref:Uncharacterized protein n=1 Tax=bioreactor metagenome TaxID=1076179 RepID=A0A644YEM9_9ZZZZ
MRRHLSLDVKTQRPDGLIGILPRVAHLLAVLLGQRRQVAITPVVAIGQKHHLVRVGCQHDIAGLLPGALQLAQQHLDGDETGDAPLFIHDGARQKVARLARRHADAVELAASLAKRLRHVGSEAVILAHVAVLVLPVAGGDGAALGIDQRERGGMTGPVGFFELAVEGIHLARVQRVRERGAQLRIQRQHLGQRAVAVNALQQLLRVERQMALHGAALGLQRALRCKAAGHLHAGQRAAHHDEHGPQNVSARRSHWQSGRCRG